MCAATGVGRRRPLSTSAFLVHIWCRKSTGCSANDNMYVCVYNMYIYIYIHIYIYIERERDR